MKSTSSVIVLQMSWSWNQSVKNLSTAYDDDFLHFNVLSQNVQNNADKMKNITQKHQIQTVCTPRAVIFCSVLLFVVYMCVNVRVGALPEWRAEWEHGLSTSAPCSHLFPSILKHKHIKNKQHKHTWKISILKVKNSKMRKTWFVSSCV